MANGLLDQAQQAAAPPAAAPAAPAGGGSVVPDLAAAAAQAGSPGPQQAGAEATAPGTPGGEVVQAQTGSNAGGLAEDGAVDVGTEQATPEEQAEYERAMTAMAQVLYTNEKTSNAIVDQVDPNNKIDSTSKASMLFFQQLDEKVDMDEAVVAQMTQESVARIMELAENRHNMTYDDREQQIILSTVWEGIQTMFGMDEADHQQAVASVGADKLGALKQTYEAALNG